MDTGFDMNTNFSAAASRNNLSMILSSVNMEKYVNLLIQKGVDFHTFANMTRDDMRIVGITNHQDQDVLLAVTKPMSRMYEGLKPKTPKWSRVVATVHDQTLTLAGSLVSFRRSLTTMPVKQSLVDQDTTSIQAIYHILGLIESRADILKSDLNEVLQRFSPEVKSKSRSSNNLLFISLSLLAGSAIMGGYLVLFKKQ
ncbi:hypothetical protein GE061_003435 [Apolygus lucorum]|uniref:SAM domain-containing protein n=1 Tax=Apolygus lucorum TaxID=248454 RepID=A0A6A4JRT4_APOLU|nr:hypothetical protein GE061_003435 [Apolygus lucorum]